MSDTELAQKIADMLKPTAELAAKGAVTSQMKNLEGLIGRKIESCIDGKCDTIAAKTIEKLQPELKDIRSKVKEAITIKGHTPHDIFDCPTCKPIALSHLLKDEKHRSGLLEMVCKDGVCKPIVAGKLWEDDEYKAEVLGKILKDETQRGGLLGRICEDEECRKGITKIFEEKGYAVGTKKEETWTQRRRREMAEEKKKRTS